MLWLGAAALGAVSLGALVGEMRRRRAPGRAAHASDGEGEAVLV